MIELQGNLRFLVIDDDPINNMICRMTIEITVGKADIQTFTNPAQGFDYVKSEYVSKHDTTPAILLLDINMPVMNGWEFLERFDNLDSKVKQLIKIYILSSSVDERDKDRSYANKNVSAFLVKPLIKDNVVAMIGEHGKPAEARKK